MKQLKRLLRYLDSTRFSRITYGSRAPHIRTTMTAFSDSEWAADTTTRHSHSGETVMLNGGAISWTSKQHDVVALSTTEAEYVALSRASQSAAHFRHLLQDVHHRQIGPTTMYEDNEGTVKLVNIPMASHMTKHIDIRLQCTKELVDAHTIAVVSIPTSDMLADGVTKAFLQPKHTMLFKRCLGSIPSTSGQGSRGAAFTIIVYTSHVSARSVRSMYQLHSISCVCATHTCVTITNLSLLSHQGYGRFLAPTHMTALRQ
jgi:hypothetical protein